MRVLVLDSEFDSARQLQKGLEAEYYAVDVVHDAENGERLSSSDEYDLIILNTNLVDKDALNFIKDTRAHNINSPIIVISEDRSARKKTEFLNIGADDYLVKPFHFEELSARIRAILRRNCVESEEPLLIGDLFLDPVGHIVKIGEEEINLRNREFDLLEYLMRNFGRVVTRNMVLEHVWDINADAFSNTIEVHITHLRKKLGNAGVMIKTVRGIGYKLTENE